MTNAAELLTARERRQIAEVLLSRLPRRELNRLPERILRSDALTSIPYRVWRWPMIGPYNGFDGVERIRGWQVTHWLHETGLLDRPGSCDICGSRSGRIQLHNENYYDVLSAPAVCQGCHSALHVRFRNPRAFSERMQPYLGCDTWLDYLLLVRFDLAQEVRLINRTVVTGHLADPGPTGHFMRRTRLDIPGPDNMTPLGAFHLFRER